MRVQYHWTQREWAEAVSLANQRGSAKKSSLPGMTIALVVIPILGASGELVSDLRSQHLSRVDLMLPILLIVFAVLVTVSLLVARRQRLYRMLQQAAMPEGECEVVVQESGWAIRELRELASEPAAGSGLQPWSELRESRRGHRVLVLLHADRFEALPLRSLTPDQDGHIRRLLSRKLRPAVA